MRDKFDQNVCSGVRYRNPTERQYSIPAEQPILDNAHCKANHSPGFTHRSVHNHVYYGHCARAGTLDRLLKTYILEHKMQSTVRIHGRGGRVKAHTHNHTRRQRMLCRRCGRKMKANVREIENSSITVYCRNTSKTQHWWA